MARKKRSKKKSKPAKAKASSGAEAGASDIEVDLDADDGSTAADLVGEIQALDAVIDEELDGSEDLNELIAATVAGAAPEEQQEELPVQSLDEEPAAVTSAVDSEEAVTPRVLEAEDAAPKVHAEEASTIVEASTEGPATADDEPATSPTPSEENPEVTDDLGDVSSPEVRDRLLAQALAHAEQQDARYRIPFTDSRTTWPWRGMVAAGLFLVAAVAAVAPPAWVRPEPPARMDALEEVRGIRHALLLQAQQVDAYRVRTQQLPRSLEELGVSLPGIRYVRSGNRAFQLIAYTLDGNTIVFDSSNPAPDFEQVQVIWSVGAAE